MTKNNKGGMEIARDNQARKQQFILPAHFFSSDKTKTKLNWFCFEFALELEEFICRDQQLRLQLRQKNIDDKAIANFCIQYAKGMKNQIFDRISNCTANVRFSYEEIEFYFPDVGDFLVDCLLTIAAEAWDSLIENCIHCSTRCISEKNEKAPMFDAWYCQK